MLNMLDAWLMKHVQRFTDAVTFRTGVTSLEMARDTLLIHTCGFVIIFANQILQWMAGDKIRPEMLGGQKDHSQIWFVLAIFTFLGIVNMLRWRHLDREAKKWRNSWESGEIPARPLLHKSVDTPFLRLFNPIILSVMLVFILLTRDFEVTNGWEAAYVSLLFPSFVVFYLLSVSHYFEVVTPRRPGGKRKVRENQVPKGVVATQG